MAGCCRCRRCHQQQPPALLLLPALHLLPLLQPPQEILSLSLYLQQHWMACQLQELGQATQALASRQLPLLSDQLAAPPWNLLVPRWILPPSHLLPAWQRLCRPQHAWQAVGCQPNPQQLPCCRRAGWQQLPCQLALPRLLPWLPGWLASQQLLQAWLPASWAQAWGAGRALIWAMLLPLPVPALLLPLLVVGPMRPVTALLLPPLAPHHVQQVLPQVPPHGEHLQRR